MVGEYRCHTFIGCRTTVRLPIDLNDHLRRFEDGMRRVEGMKVLLQRKIGDRVQLVEVRAGDHEEIAQHPVAEPVGRQIREQSKCNTPRLPPARSHPESRQETFESFSVLAHECPRRCPHPRVARALRTGNKPSFAGAGEPHRSKGPTPAGSRGCCPLPRPHCRPARVPANKVQSRQARA